MVKTHIRLWLILIFLMMLVIPFFVPPEQARARVTAEYEAATSIFGVERASEIASSANTLFTDFMNGTGLANMINAGYVTEQETRNQLVAQQVNQDMAVVSNKFLLTLTTQLYGVIFRTKLMLHWLVYVGVFLVAALIDGISQRQIKSELLQMHAPIKFAMATHMGVVVLFTPLVYLLLPISVTPWFMPIWAVVMAWPISQTVTNFAKVR